MKPIVKNSSFILILFALAFTCSKEKEEKNVNETNLETFEVVKAGSKAAANWKKFNSTAEKLMAITSSNLKSLAAIREKTLIVDEQQSLLLIYTENKNRYNELKINLADKNASFKKDIVNYDRESEAKYRQFADKFLSDILDLNNNLEDLIEEVKEGPMQD